MQTPTAFIGGAGGLPLRGHGLRTSHSTAVRVPTAMRLPRVPRVNFRLPRFGGFGGFGGLGGFGGFGAGGIGASGGIGGSSGGAGRGPRRRNDGAAGGGSSGGGNVFAGLWDAYNRSLDNRPILTKALTSFIGFFLGDLLAQKFLTPGGEGGIDAARLARMASFGFLFHGPTGHYFYGFLDRLITGKSIAKVASKVAIDQIAWAPVFTACFFVYLGVAEGKTVEQIIDKIKKDTIVGVTTSWKFWPLAHAINFALIPTQQRLLYINTLQVGYNVILSIIGNR